MSYPHPSPRSFTCILPAILVGLVASLPVGPAPARGEDGADTEFLSPSSFDETLSDDWSLSPGQRRLLAAIGVVAGMIGFAALAAYVVTRLGDRGPSGPPAPLADLAAPTPVRRSQPAAHEPAQSS